MFVRIRSAAASADEEQKNCGQPYCDCYYAWNELPPTGGVQMVWLVVAFWVSWSTVTVVSSSR